MGKRLSALSLSDIKKSLNKAGITGNVQSSQIIESVQQFLQSEFPKLPQNEVRAQSVRHDVLVVQVSHPTQAQILKDNQHKIIEYVKITSGTEISRIQFTIQSQY